MPRIRMTARGVEGLSVPPLEDGSVRQVDFWDDLTVGLCLRVSSAGRRTWTLRYRTGEGKQRRMKLGEFPHLSLSDARDAARAALHRTMAGEDPAAELSEVREGARTFRALAEEILKARAARTREKTQVGRRSMLNRHVLPAWGAREASSITRRDVVLLVEKVARDGAPVVANRVLSLVHLIFNDGIRRGFPGIESNPAHLVEKPTQEGSRDRYLLRSEVRAVWAAIEADANPSVRGAFQIALLTGQRIGSVLAMRWDLIEPELWRIPEPDFKGRRAHLVPLSPEALEVLSELEDFREVGGQQVFPSRAGSRRPHMTNMGTPLRRVRERAGIPHWVVHDFRTTFRTHATRALDDGGLGAPGHVADAVLGHVEGTLGFSRYTGDQERYLLSEKRAVLREWGAWVRSVIAAGPS